MGFRQNISTKDAISILGEIREVCLEEADSDISSVLDFSDKNITKFFDTSWRKY